MAEAIPYWLRISLLLLAMALVAFIDWYRNGQHATKWKEYGFIILSGVVGMVFGLFNDLITSSISPEYFIVGKGLAAGEGLTLRAAFLGMRAGFGAGAVAGTICLYSSVVNCSRSPLPYRTILSFLWRPVTLAIAAALVAVFFCQYDPLAFSAELKGVLTPEQIRRFLVVWWIHAGLYLGLLVALVWIIVDIVPAQEEAGDEGAAIGPKRNPKIPALYLQPKAANDQGGRIRRT